MWNLIKKLFGLGNKKRYTRRRTHNRRRQVFDTQTDSWVYVCSLDMTNDEYEALEDFGSAISDSSPAFSDTGTSAFEPDTSSSVNSGFSGCSDGGSWGGSSDSGSSSFGGWD
ncbi:hypothetical protein [Pseudoalteromonas rubra]|uniref:Uncharacterized protein n=1 Tax=Pseudoalteromonas rubra TaxID=43658 RepID=A0A0U3I262_9GAMM|nr:hypothetical protein [Pseudoalteromonas rubra]ALU41935.1 hypothetical protein AT705_02715 [Pseudoalteromonas rubra]